MKILPNRSVKSTIRHFINVAKKNKPIQITIGEFSLDIKTNLRNIDGSITKRIHHIPTSNQPYSSKSINLYYHPDNIEIILGLFTKV